MAPKCHPEAHLPMLEACLGQVDTVPLCVYLDKYESTIQRALHVQDPGWSVRCNIVSNLYGTGGCFTKLLTALQSILSKFVYCGNNTCYANFKLKLCTCAHSHTLGTRTKFQLEILTINVIFGIVYFRKIILESSRNVSETTPSPKNWSGSSIVQIVLLILLEPLPEPLMIDSNHYKKMFNLWTTGGITKHSNCDHIF